MININVSGGTAKNGENLCKTCRHGISVEMANGRDVLRCQYMDKRISSPVLRCNVYQNQNTPDIYSMKEIAWEIKADPKGKLGFSPPDPKRAGNLSPWEV